MLYYIAYYIYTLLYFLVNYVFTNLSANIYIFTTFLSLSKPIGELTFAIVFWNISNIVGYEKISKSIMIISGLHGFLIFGSNQAFAQTLTPYLPLDL